MAIYKYLLSALIVVSPSIFANGEQLPSTHEIHQMMQSYNRSNGKTGETIAYIPTERPCLNVLSKKGYEEFCIFNNEESLATSDRDIAQLSLTYVSKKYIYFDYESIKYSMHCLYEIENDQPICDAPYTN